MQTIVHRKERGSLELTYVGLDPAVVLTVTSGGSLSLTSMAVLAAVLGVAELQHERQKHVLSFLGFPLLHYFANW